MRATLTHALTRWAHREQDEAQATRPLPPYLQSLAAMDRTVRFTRRVALVGFLALASLLGWQQVQLHRAYQALRTQDYLVVPGAADFVSVRPNMIPDVAVLEFAAYFAERMVTVTYRDVDQRYKTMSRYMSPALWARVQSDLETAKPLLERLHASEIFQASGPPEIRRESREGRTVFVAELEGHLERYAGDKRIGASEEVITMTFRSTPPSAETPWVFEVISFERRSLQEHETYARTQE